MNTIRFLGDYEKLQGQTAARLLDVFPLEINDEDSHRTLIDYDTRRIGTEPYQLKPGKYVMLLFQGNKLIPFTTIRTQESYLVGVGKVNKLEFYNKLIGQPFDIRRDKI